jgi:hypothetical protein
MGQPMKSLRMRAGLPEAFWAKTRIENRGYLTPCLYWTGAKTDGYGRFGVNRRPAMAHRLAYEALMGPIPDGLVLDHLCRNRPCVAVDHLEAVTQRENLLRGDTDAARRAGQTECIHGHPFDEANTFYPRDGGRECRTCRNAQGRARRARKRATSIP